MSNIVYTKRGSDGRHSAYDATTHQPVSAAASGWKAATNLQRWLQDQGYSVVRAPRVSRPAPVQTCEWFARCDRPATHNEPHPVLGSVPACDRCPTIGR